MATIRASRNFFGRAPLGARAFSSTPTARTFAKISVLGRLGADAELVTTSSGRELLRYSVATQSGTVDNRTTSWWKVTAFPTTEGGRDSILNGFKKG